MKIELRNYECCHSHLIYKEFEEIMSKLTIDDAWLKLSFWICTLFTMAVYRKERESRDALLIAVFI